MNGSERSFGLAYLTLAPLPAPVIIAVAAEAGYDFVGLRVQPFSADAPPLHMEPGSALLAESVRRLRDTGMRVLDIEMVVLTERSHSSDWRPLLEAGAELGASLISVAIADEDPERARDHLAELTSDASPFGLRPALEPISYQRVNSLADAESLARATGAALVLDPLHLARTGTSVEAVQALPSDLVPVLQLCDAPAAAPSGGLPADLQFEARSHRLAPGAGELPLRDLVRAVAPGTPISVEVPDIALHETMSDVEFARRNLAAATALVESAAAGTEGTR